MIFLNTLSSFDTFFFISYGWIILGIITFLCLFFGRVTAPFGRHTRSDWGPLISNSWGWFIMEIISPVFLWIGFLWGSNHTPIFNSWSYIAMFLWSIHYYNRACVFPFRMQNNKKKMPVIIMSSAVFFNIINGSLNGIFLSFHETNVMTDWWIWVGVVLFILGMYINIKSDNILLSLRKPGESHYVIPKGFLFDKVASPNLFGEIIEWTGFFLIVPNYASLSFLIWTLANLLPRARDHYEWYIKKFDDFPKDRKVVFPFIY
ncbi:DUF1295 domain-containing protein [Flammeovirga yaeyamensis]|uniref:DUF1295 domain-containing protein n=1 Tax=Flammeovirga yaeyamensis TaxID=367791 RepID=A0AAX1N4D7_9BACT|nr:DUF1295 domain-containing protein [Flammeovirga yaeyamensis]MBB3700152.1 hypothetical protein [Flammeovirga yaeyamensis]NMF37218.1 DUF1295 domain-containing protein [Flammeovirga yaeyamensis]QWG00907.1 DUF1295 domain-containing protein [Flammeovirga yaeyamensis]